MSWGLLPKSPHSPPGPAAFTYMTEVDNITPPPPRSHSWPSPSVSFNLSNLTAFELLQYRPGWLGSNSQCTSGHWRKQLSSADVSSTMEAMAGVRPSFERNLDQLWYSGIVHPGQSYSTWELQYMRVVHRVTNMSCGHCLCFWQTGAVEEAWCQATQRRQNPLP